mmetsp:Transcript_16781/g.53083  ORF Transcript_16781/g.53083 Transcript_16781/m.53083 type:complete len:223 (-) Transcript_16781:1984-2652(-)
MTKVISCPAAGGPEDLKRASCCRSKTSCMRFPITTAATHASRSTTATEVNTIAISSGDICWMSGLGAEPLSMPSPGTKGKAVPSGQVMDSTSHCPPPPSASPDLSPMESSLARHTPALTYFQSISPPPSPPAAGAAGAGGGGDEARELPGGPHTKFWRTRATVLAWRFPLPSNATSPVIPLKDTPRSSESTAAGDVRALGPVPARFRVRANPAAIAQTASYQ